MTDDLGDIRALAPALDRLPGDERGHFLGGHGSGEVGLHGRGAHGVDRDAHVAELVRENLRQGDDRGLGRGVDGLALQAEGGGHGGKVHDAAAR